MTPLMASMARVIYNPRPGEEMEGIRDPEELCRPSLASREAVELILLDGFIPAAYRKPGRWTGEQAQPWLSFLASHLQNTTRTEDFAWWQLREAKVSGVSTGALAGLAAGVTVGLLGAIVGALLGNLAFRVQGGLLLGIAGLAIGVPVGHQCAAYVKANHAMPPSRGLDVRWKRLIILFIASSVFATLVGRFLFHAQTYSSPSVRSRTGSRFRRRGFHTCTYTKRANRGCQSREYFGSRSAGRYSPGSDYRIDEQHCGAWLMSYTHVWPSGLAIYHHS